MIRRRRSTAIRILRARAASQGSASFMGSKRPFLWPEDMRKKVVSEVLKAAATEKKVTALPLRQSIKKAARALNKSSGTVVTGNQAARPEGKALAAPQATPAGESDLLRNWRTPLQKPPAQSD